MAKRNLIDQFNEALEEILANPNAFPSAADSELVSLLSLAADLRHLPSQEFRRNLKTRLMRAAKRTDEQSEKENSMTTAVQFKTTATPYLSVRNASAAIEFYKNAFGAIEIVRLQEPDGRIGHAEIEIGEARIMLADEYPEYGIVGPQTIGGSGVTIHLNVENANAYADRAVAAGAKLVRPVQDEFYGERAGKIQDPFGHTWFLSQHIEDISAEEMQRRYDEIMKAAGESAQPPAVTEKPGTEVREGFQTVTPYLTVSNPEGLIDFVKQTFGAIETFRTIGSAGGLHAEVKIGTSMIMIGGMEGIDDVPACMHLYIDDVDTAYMHALKAGAVSIEKPGDQSYGERRAGVKDPFGNTWYMASPIKK